jgi:poly-gamma-glutamate capsule biosynthesis protein CapA/YwtB (metallophosphatase superfamily)
VLVAGGDVNLGRKVGQRILHDAAFDPFAGIRPLLVQADVAFANLESPLSDQNGETEDRSRLAFVGPPRGAELLARAPFHLVSVANNHAWDYDRRGFLDTLAALEGARVAYAGGSREPGEQYRPAVLRVKGWSLALFAVTHLWNPGEFSLHEAREHVAWADIERLTREIRSARGEHDLVLVSYHGGREYSELPAQEPVDFVSTIMRAGADAVLAHHPHVPQGVGWQEQRPIFYSLGNLVFGKNRHHAWTARGYLAHLTFTEGGPIQVAACPYVIDHSLPRLVRAPAEAEAFRRYLRRTSAFASQGGTELRPLDERGCIPLAPGSNATGDR